MPGMQFEFDEKGGTFYYFLVSFYALVLLPLTYFFWPKSDSRESAEQNKKKCHCEPCQIKRHLLKTSNPSRGIKRKLLKLIFIIAWVVFIALAYKVSQIELEWTEFDPFAELGIDRDASMATVRKAYKQLSLKYHPDKGGDPKRFIRLSKAYSALTNEQSRKNWQEYGNPDGPGATQFGIALPKWIVEKKNSVWVLGAYAFVFMIILPVSVGSWWYRTIKFSSDKILLGTSQIFTHLFRDTPNMTQKRVIFTISFAFEFSRLHNSEIVERLSDNEEMTALIKTLTPYIPSKEMLRAYPYAVKARALIIAHLHRVPLPPNTLLLDQRYILQKCPYLINELITIVARFISLCLATGVSNVPRLETLENCMRLSPLIIHALPEHASPILQLPHITQDMLRHFITRKRNVKTIRQLVEMTEEDRRSLLRTLTDEQYRDVLSVCANMPLLEMECKYEVIDEEDPSTITAGSLVTVTVYLRRRAMGSQFPTNATGASVASADNALLPSNTPANRTSGGRSSSGHPRHSDKLYTAAAPITTPPTVVTVSSKEEADSGAQGASGVATGGVVVNGVMTSLAEGEMHDSPKKKAQVPVWEINKRKRSSQQGKKKGGNVRHHHQQHPQQQASAPGKQQLQNGPTSKPPIDEEAAPGKLVEDVNGEQVAVCETNDTVEEETATDVCTLPDDDEGTADGAGEDDDDVWRRFQEESRRENSLEAKEKTTHQVHCPLFPVEKQEWWWLYVADRKNQLLITPPTKICSLQTDEKVQLQFTAPNKPRSYMYTVCLRSDSYLDMDLVYNIKFNVTEARIVEDHPQWSNISDEELDDNDDDGETVNKSGRKKKTQHADQDSDTESSGTDYDYDD